MSNREEYNFVPAKTLIRKVHEGDTFSLEGMQLQMLSCVLLVEYKVYKKTETWGPKTELDAFQIIGISKRSVSLDKRDIF